MVLSEGFLSGLYISLFTFLGAVLAVCYKSKCKKVTCCCLTIDRDIETELKEDELSINQKQQLPIT